MSTPTLQRPVKRPDHVPAGAVMTTLGRIVDSGLDLGEGRYRVRVSFRQGMNHATGPLLSIERSECGTAGRLHLARGYRGRHFFFDAEAMDETPCWIWTIADEEQTPAARRIYDAPVVSPTTRLG